MTDTGTWTVTNNPPTIILDGVFYDIEGNLTVDDLDLANYLEEAPDM
ncbi:MAG: hypothetical protein L3J79_07315 [Candidatus Marinimicrobia bacterium]|nr:hypothetical protein [Candidatus Neomarinimicrobiota bacterium]